MKISGFTRILPPVQAARELFGYLPSSNREAPPKASGSNSAFLDPPDRPCPLLDAIIPESSELAYDMKDVVHSVFDDERFFEIMPGEIQC